MYDACKFIMCVQPNYSGTTGGSTNKYYIIVIEHFLPRTHVNLSFTCGIPVVRSASSYNVRTIYCIISNYMFM